MKQLILVLLMASVVTGCAGSPIADAIAGPKKLAEQDDAYCRSIGARGSDYTQCRLFMTKHRDDRHTTSRLAAASALQNAGQAMQRSSTTCTSTGSYSYRTTTCY